jgi:hypothetical protein
MVRVKISQDKSVLVLMLLFLLVGVFITCHNTNVAYQGTFISQVWSAKQNVLPGGYIIVTDTLCNY